MKLASTLILALLTVDETDPLGLAGRPHSRSFFGQAMTSSRTRTRVGPKGEVSPPFFEYLLNSFSRCENGIFKDSRMMFATLEK